MQVDRSERLLSLRLLNPGSYYSSPIWEILKTGRMVVVTLRLDGISGRRAAICASIPRTLQSRLHLSGALQTINSRVCAATLPLYFADGAFTSIGYLLI